MLSLDHNEHIILKIRKHWFLLAVHVVILTALFILPLILARVVAYFNILHFGGNAAALAAVFVGIWLLALWISFFSFWTTFYFDVWVVTNKRIIDIDQRRLFNREIATMRLDRIQDIVIEVRGILASVLNLGVLKVQSAGESQEFVMTGVAEPYKVKDAIARLANQAAEAIKTVRLEGAEVKK